MKLHQRIDDLVPRPRDDWIAYSQWRSTRRKFLLDDRIMNPRVVIAETIREEVIIAYGDLGDYEKKA